MNHELKTHYQRGIAPVLILIVLAAVIGAGAVAYGYFIVNKSATPSQSEISRMQNPLEQQTVQVGTPQCPELDYTGCDTSQNWMTWTDDGIR